jgi:hypothetical protein
MKRRTLLGTIGTAGLVTLTGCLSDDGRGTPSDTGTAADTPSPMPTPTPALTDSGFEIVSEESGTQADSASVSVDGATVVVEGTIWGSNGCQTAELDSVNYNDGTLTVAVATTRATDADEMCTQQIVKIDYRTTAEFANGLPDTVVVTHSRDGAEETVVRTSL